MRQKTNDTRDHYRVNKKLQRKAVDRAISSYSQHAHVFDEIANRLLERLDLLKAPPARVLDLGTGNGRHLEVLRRRYPKATIIGADINQSVLRSARRSLPGWQRLLAKRPRLVCMDAGEQWPFADESFDLVVSNMMLPWINETDKLASELARVLATGGAFFISSAGPDTLKELRSAWESIDACAHVNAFLDMHDLGDMFVRAGLADPVMDSERIEVRYKDTLTLLTELELTGCTCVLCGRRQGLMGRQVRQLLVAHYPDSQSFIVDESDHSSTISATLELVVAHGWKMNNQHNRAAGQQREQVVHFQPKFVSKPAPGNI